MFARYFFTVLGILSLSWIAYVGFGLIDKKNPFAPITLFGTEDGELLIINRLEESNFEKIGFNTTEDNSYLFKKISPNLVDYKSIYISKNRNHILLETEFPWSTKRVHELLTTSGIDAKTVSLKEISIPHYSVEIKKNRIYFYAENYSSTAVSDWDKFDRKSSASKIRFQRGKASITDIYYKNENTFEFKAENTNDIAGVQINDKQVFSTYLPQNFQSYHFREKEYFKKTDPIFASGPMAEWVETGVVKLIIKGETVLITDYKAGQNPIEVLNDKTNSNNNYSDNGYFENVQLSKDYPGENKDFYIYKMNDMVVISENPSVCESVITEIKLGHTLSSNETKLASIYSGLPRKVSERIITSKGKSSKTIYKDRILSTSIITKKENRENDLIESKPYLTKSMKIDERVLDFISLPGFGNCIVLTENGKIIGFQNGMKSWVHELNMKPLGPIELLEDNQTILLTSSKSIYLISINGEMQQDIEIQGDKILTQPATVYSWKGNQKIAAFTSNGEILTIQLSNKSVSQFKSNFTEIKRPIDVWVSQNKLFYGLNNGSKYEMFDADRKRSFRSFAITANLHSQKINKQVNLIGIDNENLIRFDQKGNKDVVKFRVPGRLIPSRRTNDLTIAYIGNSVNVFDRTNNFLGNVKTTIKEPDQISAISMEGRTIISVIDGIENNVYLYGLNGKLLYENSLEGSRLCRLQVESGNLIVSTIVDDYIVQYKIKL